MSTKMKKFIHKGGKIVKKVYSTCTRNYSKVDLVTFRKTNSDIKSRERGTISKDSTLLVTSFWTEDTNHD